MGEWGCLGWQDRQNPTSVREEGGHSKATLDLNSGTKVPAVAICLGVLSSEPCPACSALLSVVSSCVEGIETGKD